MSSTTYYDTADGAVWTFERQFSGNVRQHIVSGEQVYRNGELTPFTWSEASEYLRELQEEV